MLQERLLLVKEGNFSWKDVMKMPIWERKYYTEQLIEISKNAKENTKKTQ